MAGSQKRSACGSGRMCKPLNRLLLSRSDELNLPLTTEPETRHEIAGQPAGAGPSRAEVAAIRCLDVVFALGLLLFALPLMLLIPILIKVTDRGPALFVQHRIGKDGIPFKCLKFRSMATNAEQRLQQMLAQDPAVRQLWSHSHKLVNDPRITPIGKFLRRYRLDELAQLFGAAWALQSR